MRVYQNRQTEQQASLREWAFNYEIINIPEVVDIIQKTRNSSNTVVRDVARSEEPAVV